jgi:hypothetical protein
VAIRRLKLCREASLTLDRGRVVDIPPGWAFAIDTPYSGRIKFDFNPYRENGRDDLAGQMRDAVWSLRHEAVGVTLIGYETSLRYFWRFLDEMYANGEAITRLDQVDRTMLDRYLAWLELQVVARGKRKGRPYAFSTKKTAFAALKTLLVNRQKRMPASVSPELTFPRNPFPNMNQRIPKREAYSASEQDRIVEALNKDLRAIHEGEGDALNHLQVLIVHLLIFGLATGRNLQSLLELQRDSLKEHPLPDREILVTYKRRGWSTHATSHRKAAAADEEHCHQREIPAYIGDHFRFLCEFTAPMADEAAEDDRKMAFLWRVTMHQRKGQVVRLDKSSAGYAVRAFVKRHALLDERAGCLMLNVARLRPTFANELYRRTRDIRCVQRALGHAKAQTTARHYANPPLEAERDHAIVLDAMVSQFTRMEIDGKVLLAADGKIPLQDVPDLLSGGYSTGIARCRNPFREDSGVCMKFFPCFICRSMVVFEDDLWRLFSFYYRLLAERPKLSPHQWLNTYGPIIRRIDTDIAPQFPADKVEAARLRAQHDPHPTWKGPFQ